MSSGVKCLECEAENSDAERVCHKCGTSLRPALAMLYLERSEAEISRGRYDLASKNLTKADAEMLAMSTEERNKYMLTARAFWLQGSIYYFKGMMQEAEQELALAHQNLEQHPNGAELLALVLNRWGSIAYYDNRPDEAVVRYRRSNELAMQIGAYATASKAIGNLGIILANSEPEEAMNFYRQAMTQAEASKDPGVIAQMYRLLARFYTNRGPYSLALEYANKGLAIAEQLEDLYVRCLNLDVAASVHLRSGNIEQAVAYLREAYDLTRFTNNKLTTEVVMLTIAELMRYDEFSEPWFEQAMKEFNETIGSAISKGRYALQMAYYYIRQQDQTRVRRFLQQLNLIDPDKMSQGNPILIVCAQALLHAALEEWDEASTLYQRAIGSGKLSPYDLAVTYENYATLLTSRAKDSDPAIKKMAVDALRQAATIYRELELPLRCTAVEARLAELS